MSQDQGVAPNEIEEWFLDTLAADEPSVPALVDAVLRLKGLGEAKKGAELAVMLREELLKRGNTGEALQALQAESACRADSRTFREHCGKQVLDVLGDDPSNRKLVKGAGFDASLELEECFRRLQLLRTLAPGVLCFDKTWGFGVVKRMDAFYERVEIDFERKSDHHLSYAYAGEALQLLNESHLLARRHRDPEAIQRMVEDDPAEIVRITLKSYGPLSAQLLEERITTDLIDKAAWKKFWAAARKDLKKDPMVVMSTKRSEPIILLDQEMAYDDAWFEELAAERKMERILERVDELIEDKAELSETHLGIVGERLAFVVKGAGRRQPGLAARALMDAYELKVSEELVDCSELVGRFLEPSAFHAATSDLPARELEPFLGLLREQGGDRLLPLLLDQLHDMDASLISHTATLLEAAGQTEDLAARMLEPLSDRRPVPDVLLWIWRNPDTAKAWGLWDPPLLVELTLAALELNMPPGEIRAQNALKERFRQPEWVKMVLDALDLKARARTLERVKSSTAWPELDKRSVLGLMIKCRPELQQVLTGEESEVETKAAGPVTSHRSYRERQKKLEKIINVDIPENSKEIAVARSHGDLRENFEYQAAKDMQGILMRRRGELEIMLNEVTPTDFEGYNTDKAGMATEVVLAFDDGRTERYVILGAWDQDAEMGIISSSTELAQVLQGHVAGERVEVPREVGTEVCLLKEVNPIPEAVRAWMAMEAPGQGGAV